MYRGTYIAPRQGTKVQQGRGPASFFLMQLAGTLGFYDATNFRRGTLSAE